MDTFPWHLPPQPQPCVTLVPVLSQGERAGRFDVLTTVLHRQLCVKGGHTGQSAPKMVQRCQECHRKMRRGEKLWQVLAKRGTRGNWRREGGSQLARCYEGTQVILQQVKKCTMKCKHKDNSRMWSNTHLQAQGSGKSALGNGKCWEML